MMKRCLNFGHVGIKVYTRSMQPALSPLAQKLRQSQMSLLLIRIAGWNHVSEGGGGGSNTISHSGSKTFPGRRHKSYCKTD
jgi:hypothetical protein